MRLALQVLRGRVAYTVRVLYVNLYKILFHFKALLWESIILCMPPATCKVYPIAILLHNHCTIYAPPPTTRPAVLYVECAERRLKYGILFIYSRFYEYSNLEYVRVPV